MLLIKWILFCLGHVALACVLFNRVHAFAFPNSAGKRSRKITEKLILVFAVFPFPVLFYLVSFRPGQPFPKWLALYFIFGQLVGLFFIARWLYRWATQKLPLNTKLISSELVSIQPQGVPTLFRGLKGKLLSYVPFNQVTFLRIENWEFLFSDLPPELHGLKICQLSDLHFTGIIDQRYFDEVVHRANAGKPDLIVITGDILDEDSCLDWIEDVLAKLRAKIGVYFIRGNHDLMISDQDACLQRLKNTGMIWAADGKWHEVAVGGRTIQIAGNELPWFNHCTSLPLNKEKSDLRILLAHSPDQIGWAVKRNFDVVFAGHTHGGQIRLPIAGPIIAPSRYGIKFASGTFKIRDTLMHVSRGVSGDEPIRLNCPPELSFFTLIRSHAEGSS